MAINRRNFLFQASSVAITGLLPIKLAAATTQEDVEHIIGTSRLDEHHYAVSSVQPNGRLNWQMPLPSRGHDVCCHDNKPMAVVVARRPDRYLILFNPSTGEALQTINVDAELKLNGHACWVDDTLMVTGSNRASSQMCLLIYTLKANQLVLNTVQYYDYTGPHEILYNNGELWVAVGGLITTEREVTNKGTLESFLLRLDTQQLTVMHEYRAPYASVSLRHLAISDHGEVFIAGQFQLDPSQSPPLLYCLRDEKLVPFKTTSTLWPQVNGYIGSIECVDNKLIASSPRSHWLGWFDIDTLMIEKFFLSADVCALAKTQQGIIAGSGTGMLYIQGQLIASKVKWDNHFTCYLNKPIKPANIS